MSPEVLVQPGKPVLQHTHFRVLQFVWYGHRGGGDITNSKYKKQNRQYRNLPGDLVCVHELVEGIRIVKLCHIADIQERKKESKTFPHPGVESVYGNIHVISLAQRA